MAMTYPVPGSPEEEPFETEEERLEAVPEEEQTELFSGEEAETVIPLEEEPEFEGVAAEEYIGETEKNLEPERSPTTPPPPLQTPPPAIEPLSPSDERTWAMLSHLSVLLNLVTGFLGPVVPLVIYFAYKDRSRFVGYQSMQAFVFQMIWWVGAGIAAGIAWTISGVLTVVLIGCLLMPVALLISLIPLAALVYGVIAAIQVSNGENFRYWLIGDWVADMLR